jgi:hypothetical protein
MMHVHADSVDVTTYFVLRLAADGTEATGLTITNFDLQYVRSGVAPAVKVDATALAATDSAHADGKAIEIDATDQPGLYRVDWPDAAFATGVKEVILSVKCATAFTEHLRVMIDPPVNVERFGGTNGTFSSGRPEVNTTHWLGTAAATPTVAGVPEVDVTHWIGTAVATPTTAGVPEVDVTFWGGSATPVTNLNTVFNTDFATNYNTTADGWVVKLGDYAHGGTSANTTLGTLTVGGTTSLAAVTTSGTVTMNALTVSNATTLTGNVSLGGTLSTTGTVTFNAFTVTNATTLSGAVSLGSTLGVTGTTTLAAVNTGAIATSGTVTFNAFTVSNATTLSGAVSLGSTLGVTGTTTLAALTTTGTTTFNALTVTNAFTAGTWTVSGATSWDNLVDDIWDEDATGHQTTGTFGQTIGDSVGSSNTIYSYVAALYDSIIAIGGTVNDASATTTAFDTNLTDANDFWNDALLTFTSGALAGQTKPILDFANSGGRVTLDEATTSAPANGVTFKILRTHLHPVTQIGTGVWATATRSLTVLDEDSTTLDLDATIRSAVGLASANLDTQIGDLPTNAELATSQASADDATLAAIAALNNIAAADVWAAGTRTLTALDEDLTTLDLDATIKAAVGLASANLDTQLDALPTNAELATAIITGLTTALTEGYRGTGATGSVRDMLYEILAHLGESAIVSTTKTLKKLDGSTTAKTYTLDSATTPTSITETT